MKSKIFCKCCFIAIMTFFLTNDFVGAETMSGDPQTVRISGNLYNSKFTENQLPSAISPSSPPTLVIGSASNFDPIINVNVATNVFYNQTTTAAIVWGGNFLTGSVPSTCTWALSSPPPGPSEMYLTSASGDTTSIVVDSTTGAIYNDFASSPPANSWFPTGGPKTFTSVTLKATGLWFTSVSKDKAEAYPSLQWSPAYITLIYQ